MALNGRPFAVGRAWDAGPLFPDAPAAAAISPDPCARCAWPGDGTNYPYLGPLYNNSLPPTAYRLQSGCMPNLGQFWPPTPPPDGCGRFDGSNLYFGPTVLRTTEAISSNIRNSYQNLGHFSHVVETPKESSQRILKREATISPSVSTPNTSTASKADTIKHCCGLKSPSSFAYSLPKQDLPTVSSGQEPYLYVPDIRTSTIPHPSTDKSCLSPSYNAKNSLLHHGSSQDPVTCKSRLPENNASPLKNVYFSHFESEHVNTVQSNKHFNTRVSSFEHNSGGRFHQGLLSRSGHSDSYLHKRCEYPSIPDYTGLPLKHDKQDGVFVIKEHVKHRSLSSKIKAEKVSNSDCKYQRTGLKLSGSELDYRNPSVFNVPTSVVQTEVEPNDRYFVPSCSSSYLNYGATSHGTPSSCLRSSDFQDSYQAGIYPNPDRTWQYSEIPSANPKAFYKPPCDQAFFMAPPHEGLISVAQTAPLDIEVDRPTKRTLMSATSLREEGKNSDGEEDVQIIRVQSKHSTVKHGSRHTEKIICNQTSKFSPPMKTATDTKIGESTSNKKDTIANELQSRVSYEIPRVNKHNSSSEGQSKTVSELPSTTLLPIIENVTSNSKINTINIKQEVIDNFELNSPVAISPEATRFAEPVSVKAEPILVPSDDTHSPDNLILPNSECEGVKEYNENHGLNLLLNTIEKVAILEKANYTKDPYDSKQKEHFVEYSKIKGLDLLSAIAGERLVSEFDGIKMEQVEDDKVESNYPDIKERKFFNENPKNVPESVIPNAESSVFKMQDRLLELQKKYRQKQKELSRLKPKKRLANSYLKGNLSSEQNNAAEMCVNSVTSTNGDADCNAFLSSSSNNILQTVGESCIMTTETPQVLKKSNISLSASQRKVRHKLKKFRPEIKSFGITKMSKVVKRTIKIRTSKIKFLSAFEDKNLHFSAPSAKKDFHKSKENEKSKVYALRHSSHSADKEVDSSVDNIALNSKIISKKRKSDNPKKYIPSKQTKLSETIVAKHLRNRILFDTSGTNSDDDAAKNEVPEELYNTSDKCHLDEEKDKNFTSKDMISSSANFCNPSPSTLKPEHLFEKQRLLALEDNLFYAGYIKDHQMPNRYRISLDGQRGNKLHIFTREELLTQTIVESKPVSTKLPEGTRVCAFWSQQYRCLYPGFVGKASSPSADWSEPRIFVLFDDGDSGQIPIKNVRLIPSDIIPADYESRLHSQDFGGRAKIKESSSRRLRHSTKIISFNDQCNDNESKESSCVSVNESSCDDCFIEYANLQHSSKGSPRGETATASSSIAIDNGLKSQRRQKKRSKCRVTHHSGTMDAGNAKAKRHKKYKEKHHRHHHHRHRHHRHHRHHHHSKKHKHKRKSNVKIGLQNKNCKNDLSSQGPDLADHSSINLPQRGPAESC